MYIWVDFIYNGVRRDDDKLSCLVIFSVNNRGIRHFYAIEDCGRECTKSWREVLLAAVFEAARS